ncbi:transglycosylase family protein [uncultured Jatrophihabitans sp.]|uniref:transglycosylase family protein n=1 Tax=uncultured Jatrophihabitans sp. TaxID=1610747 RepID=UPI0035C96B6E
MHSSSTPELTTEQVEQPAKSRRSRAAAATLATTVGAAAVVTGALAAPADAAAHHNVWDKVAGCESGHRWHVHTGNGYYGGLQFDSSTWRRHGGHKYAHQASGASRTEQIEVARRVLHSQGRNAWPVCGPRAGLTKTSGHATGKKLPNKAGEPASSSTSHHSSKRAKPHTHKAKHRAHHSAHSYTVRKGDTLAEIARKHHVHGGWHALYRANKAHLSSPNHLRVGQHLTLP